MMFLEQREVDKLTGIASGRNGKTKHERQIEWLRGMGFPVIENARGRPILARAYVDGSNKHQAPKPSWSPSLAK